MQADEDLDDCLTFDLADGSRFETDDFLTVLDTLRQHAPVHWWDSGGDRGFWVVTSHEHASHVYRSSEDYASRHGMRLGASQDAVDSVANRMLIVSDGAEHADIRKLVAATLTPPRIRALEAIVRQVVRELMDSMLAGGPAEFVSAVARPLPTNVICTFMGLPRADWAFVGDLTTNGIDSPDEDVRVAANAELFLYFSEIMEERRRRPGPDLISTIIAAADQSAAAGGRSFSDVDIMLNLTGILIGANETTRHAVAGGLVALAGHPSQWILLKENEHLIGGAVEEILRWVSPAVHAMRTALRRTRLGGHTVEAGDRVTIWTAAANRDPAVFGDPGSFEITRTPNRHLSLGDGRHKCVGARLGRLEIAAFLGELRSRVHRIDVHPPVKWSPSNFTRGPLNLTVDFERL
jgi:cytochrome P450